MPAARSGNFDLHGFVQTLDAMGVTAAYAIEVISLDLDRLPVDEAVGRMAAASRAALDSARSWAAAPRRPIELRRHVF